MASKIWGDCGVHKEPACVPPNSPSKSSFLNRSKSRVPSWCCISPIVSCFAATVNQIGSNAAVHAIQLDPKCRDVAAFCEPLRQI